jgi:hypothetical protein
MVVLEACTSIIETGVLLKLFNAAFDDTPVSIPNDGSETFREGLVVTVDTRVVVSSIVINVNRSPCVIASPSHILKNNFNDTINDQNLQRKQKINV